MKTDSQLQQDVIAELKWEPSITSTDIGVEVKDGIVTLAGHVHSYSDKWNAERAAQRVYGVKGLAVEMDVNLPGSSKRNDADIARSAANVLQWTTYLPEESVKVTAEKGWITLTGEVDWEFQRQEAAAAVRHQMGVTGVSNQIVARPLITSNGVKTEIEAALKRRATADADEITVAVKGGDVVLTGKVHSWSERELANQSAWSSPGVSNVVDKMTMAY